MVIMAGATAGNNQDTLLNGFIKTYESDQQFGDAVGGYKIGSGMSETPSFTQSSGGRMTLNAIVVRKVGGAALYTLTTTALNGSITYDPLSSVFVEGAVVTVEAIPDSGFEFLEWIGDLSGSTNPTTITMDSDKSIEARFKVEGTETVPWVEDFSFADGTTADTMGTTSWTAMRSTGTFEVRDSALVVNDAGSEGIFTTGIINIPGGSAVDVSMDIRFSEGLDDPQDYVKLYKILDGGDTLLVGEKYGGTMGDTTIISQKYIVGSTLQLMIKTYLSHISEFYYIDNLSVTKSVGPIPNYGIAVYAPNGTVTFDPPGPSYAPHTKVTLTAVPDPGYEFVEWLGAITGTTNPVTIYVDGNKGVAVTFAPVKLPHGLIAEFWNNVDYIGKPVFTKVDSVLEFDYGAGSVDTLVNDDHVGMQWQGKLVPDFSETYTLKLFHNDGCRLWIDGELLIDLWGPGQLTETTTIDLVADQQYDLIVRIFEDINTTRGSLSWSSASVAEEIIPNANLLAVEVGPDSLSNLFVNGNFSQGAANWTPQVIAPAAATFSYDNDELNVDIQAVSAEEWHVNILQSGITLEPGKTYALSFYARAAAEKVITAKAQMDGDPWASVLDEKVTISTIMEPYTVIWDQTEILRTYKLGFFFGIDTTDVWIDNVKLSDVKTVSAIEDEQMLLPQSSELMQNYPNPFNPVTTIRYNIKEAGKVELAIYDVTGRLVERMVNENQAAGSYSVKFYGYKLSTGVYFYRIKSGSFEQIKKMVLIK